MRTFRAAAVLAAAAVLLPGAGASALSGRAGATAGAVTYDAAGTARLYSLVNAHRRANGLPALAVDTRLASIARTWTVSMATTEHLAHNDALFTKATHSLLGIRNLGENVAFASLGVERAHVILMESPPHRANIDNAAYAVGGFAVVRDAKGVTWVTEDFGSRPVAATAPKPAAVAPRMTTAKSAAAPRTTPAKPAAAPAPAAPAAPPYVAPSAPRRESTTDRVDVPFDVTALAGPATAGLVTTPVAAPAASGAARAGRSVPVEAPAPVALAALLAACGVAGLRASVVRRPHGVPATMEL